MKYDHVDRLLIQWEQQRPDLDPSPMGVIGRLVRVNKIIEQRLQHAFKAHGLSAIEFDILATLRRYNTPITPTEMYQSVMLTSGAMSTRIEHMVQRGLIERIANEEDRRSCKVFLTSEGKTLIDNAVESHLENERAILQSLTEEQQEQIAILLRHWLLTNESAT
ncbi:MarR family transcriptional regulator [Xenorhabdus bovienii]|uniref:HTH-type transcriptional regulator pecS n=1 Tax=Xenorhabdus bovienii str. Intermedium TaxID=1379677 RepID=A0A077QD66_XENBV|nr:MarR family transcriptional regulator [Xenorhabdus bovienii]MDE9452827.1 MarR family transcriptional regulator [Xenorhabdus bovienii]MDE9481083.1 MarR family transcriptional regulator [Xenorhabdus bovienii]MDE9541867.1 MarR family transcriptional regulator [Xenorhabdus bovienii]MDE9555391.1 MarR family transcriptional regulator [Xenorhabdus bovienii]MDE9562691.1 MarR family transcriptional regulator [Xenorhabdus bovienii]